MARRLSERDANVDRLWRMRATGVAFMCAGFFLPVLLWLAFGTTFAPGSMVATMVLIAIGSLMLSNKWPPRAT